MRKWTKNIKDGAKLVKECTAKFLKEQEAALIGTGVTFGFVLLCKVLKVPVNIDPVHGRVGTDINHSFDFDMGMYPDDAISVATKSMVEGAMSMTFDSDKVKTAKRIKDMVHGQSFLEDDTKKYVVQALSKLAKSTTFDSAKEQINNIISDIIKEN